MPHNSTYNGPIIPGDHDHTPLFLVIQPGDDWDTAEHIRAEEAGDAVEAWAERFDTDHAEFTIVGGQPEEVLVREPGEEIERWRVSGKLVPEGSEQIAEYTATEVS